MKKKRKKTAIKPVNTFFCKRKNFWKTSLHVVSFLVCLSLFSSCGGEKDTKKNTVYFLGKRDTPMQENTERAVFSFSHKKTLFLQKNEKKQLSIFLTSDYSPVNSAHISLQYNPKFIRISNISPPEKTVLFSRENNAEKGILSAIIAFPDSILGKNIPILSFDVLSAHNRTGESTIDFISQNISALLADVKNTDIAKKTDLSPLVVSVSP